MLASLAALWIAAQATAPASAALGPAPPEKVAVLPFHVEGLAVNEVRRIDGVVRTRFRERGADLLPDDTTNAIVDSADALGLGCTLPETACAVKLGGIADVDVVIAGAAVRLKDGVGVDVRIVDVRTSSLRARQIALLPNEPNAQVAALKNVLTSVTGEAPGATLILGVEPRVNDVVIDGFTIFIEDMPAFTPGDHAMVVQAEGYVAHRETLTLKPGMNPSNVKLTEIPKPPPPPVPTAFDIAVPFVLAGTGAIVGAGGAVTAAIGSTSWFAFEAKRAELASLDTATPNYSSEAQRVNAEATTLASEWNNGGRIAVGVGAGAASIGVVAAAACTAWGVTILSEMPEGAE